MNRNKSKSRPKNKLGYIDPTVAGIDIGSKLIHVALPDGANGAFVREYGSTTTQLIQIAKDLKASGVTTAVMEATGVYWIPLFETLESEEFKLHPVLVDAKSVKNVPGRKTDVVDCQWIQTLYSSGLLRAAFRPPRERLTLREYVRMRKSIIKNRQRALLHMEKALQLMNLKLSSALSDIAGISGMAIIRAIVNGEKDPKRLVKLRNRTCRQSAKVFVDTLTGNYQDEHLFALKISLSQYDFSYEQLKECDQKIFYELEKLPTVTKASVPLRDKDLKANGRYSKARKPDKNTPTFDVQSILWEKSGIDLSTLPGVSGSSALTIFAELGGANVEAFRSEKAFCSWLKLCPGNNISGGKRRKSKRIPSVNPITQTLRLSAVACMRSKSAIAAFIRRMCGRTDKPKGIKAGAHRIGKVLYQMCKHGMGYVEKGEEYIEKAYEARVLKNMEKRAKEMGYQLVLAS
jgi:transposase